MRLAWCIFVAHPIAMPYGLECYIPGTAWDQGLGSSIKLLVHGAGYIR